jgi:membrane peptidoglycan carboxypeptidase
VRADVHVIKKVVDRTGEDPKVYNVVNTKALASDIDADVSYALQQVVQNGTGQAALALGRPAAGKTGTATNDKGDVSSAWFVGYTPQLATAVMYVRGDGDNKLDGWLPSYFGADYPARTWTAIMQTDSEGMPVEQFPPPANVDGQAPTTGHDPTPTATSTPTHRPTRTPTKTPSTSEPTSTPTTSEPTGIPTKTPTGVPSSEPPPPPTTEPTPSNTPLPTITVNPSPTQQASGTPPTPSGGASSPAGEPTSSPTARNSWFFTYGSFV